MAADKITVGSVVADKLGLPLGVVIAIENWGNISTGEQGRTAHVALQGAVTGFPPGGELVHKQGGSYLKIDADKLSLVKPGTQLHNVVTQTPEYYESPYDTSKPPTKKRRRLLRRRS